MDKPDKTLERLQKIKAAKDKSHQDRQGNEKGLYILFTGLGKGKTSSAMNLVYRHLAHDRAVAVVQFVKNSDAYPDGDRIFLTKLRDNGFPVKIHTLGGGFSWETQNPQQDREMANAALEQAKSYLVDPDISLVVLDEVHIALKNAQLDLEVVLEVIRSRPQLCHVVTTGRYAPQALIDEADLVTEMTRVKHPISQGIPAQIGIEF
ncbi:MAG: cob(I)yrinic acid a,c-diamide adenosyltransferase [Cyanobacteria bacterium SID2]|nr:cob(I)yrinic acid a,c-diamide adenosyltransferase [Cyanobacteria bacterium SID2]MBP0005824.1 cob(I)yrinic acid a,c-diamide adenosyltransferase [Cyanobacteria bacterium SBC]